MSTRSLANAAARNNAEWCHAFSRTHGIVAHFQEAFWSSPERTPPFYPDAVTLSTAATVEAVLAGIDAGEGCSVKDSFACLELGDAGFRPLFRAEWVVGPAASGRVASPRGWSALTTEAGLRAWESSWGEVPGGSGFFRPALLLDNTIMVLARRESERVVAGAVANRSTTVVGLSNVFDTAGDLESAWAAAASAAASRWGDLPIVGYDRGHGLEAAHGAGFESVGELVIWIN